MKNLIRMLAILTALMQGGLFYPASLTVVKVEKGTVVMEDRRGNQYVTDGAEAWDVGDKAAAIMYANGTLFNKADDEIVTVEYQGR